MRAIHALLAILLIASPASAIKLGMIGQAAPKIMVHRQSETSVLVWDARSELGVSLSAADANGVPTIGDLSAMDIRVARVTLDFSIMEPTEKPGVYDSAYLNKWDKLVAQCGQQGISLVIAVKGDAAGVDKNDVKAQTERLGRFCGDMAARYVSVLYWEFGENSDTCVSATAPTANAESAGKTCADMLSAIGAAVKAANASARLVSRADSQGFVQGLYSTGSPKLVDVICVGADAKSFADTTNAVRKLMTPSGDAASRPLWCLYTDGFGQQKLQETFDTNNASQLCQRILVEAKGTEDQAAWLLKQKVNSTIDSRPRNTVDVFIPSKLPIIPVGYDYKQAPGGVEVQHVVLDSLFPTEIHLTYAPQAAPAPKPGAKPSHEKRNGAPQPDPWDI